MFLSKLLRHSLLILTILVFLLNTKFGMLESIKVYASDGDPFSKIAFISRQSQGETLHVIDPATGKEDTFPLAAESVSQGLPVWSPTCDRILTDENRGDQKVIGIVAYGENGISTDLTEMKPLENLLAYFPRWSPGGDSVAFQALNWNDLENNTDIYTFSFSTGELKNLTEDPIQNIAPSWSPDGKQIVFASMSKDTGIGLGYFDIYMVNADGSSLKAVYADPETDDFMPQWSPDGNSITFISQDPNGDRILSVDINGETATVLTNNTTYRILHRSWSNDGKFIAFESANPDDDSQIFLLDVGSKSVFPITDSSKTISLFATWSPDDSQLVFQSNHDGDFEIYTLDLARKTITQLTHNDYDDIYPVWSPKSCYEN